MRKSIFVAVFVVDILGGKGIPQEPVILTDTHVIINDSVTNTRVYFPRSGINQEKPQILVPTRTECFDEWCDAQWSGLRQLRMGKFLLEVDSKKRELRILDSTVPSDKALVAVHSLRDWEFHIFDRKTRQLYLLNRDEAEATAIAIDLEPFVKKYTFTMHSDLDVAGSIFSDGSVSVLNDVDVQGKLLVHDRCGVGTRTPQFSLDVDGDINFSGALRLDGALIFPAIADERALRNVRTVAPYGALAQVKKMRPVCCETDAEDHMGFVVDEIAPLAPEVILTVKRRGVVQRMVRHDALVPRLVAALQGEDERVNHLQERVCYLEKVIAALMQCIDVSVE